MAFAAITSTLKRNTVAIAECQSFSGPGFKLDVKEVTHHGSTGKWEEFVATVLRSGEVKCHLNFLPANATQSFAAGLLKDMVDRTLQAFSIVWSDSALTTWSFNGYVVGFEPSAPHDADLGVDVTIKISGQPTLA